MDYQKVYTSLISNRIANPLKKSNDLYVEIHHIVPRCLGGSDEPENLVRLTAREHFIAHRLLAKIHRSDSKLQYAVFLMSHREGLKIVSSKGYEALRLQYRDSAKRRGLKFRDKFSKDTLERWKSDEFRTKMASLNEQRWEDPEYKRKMSAAMTTRLTELWKDKAYREHMSREVSKRMKEKWSDPSKRAIQSIKSSETMKRLRNNPEEYQQFKAKISARITDKWKDEEFSRNTKEGRKKFLDSNPWPWQRARSQPLKHIWTLAASFWELFYTEKYSVSRFSKEFCSGKHADIFYSMRRLFKDGWIPHECEDYVKEFGHKM